MKHETALPKNIRQIGEIQQDRKVYLEDYVMSFIHKKEEETAGQGCVGILAGRQETDENGSCLFVTGALLPDWEEETEKRWEKIEEERNSFFPETEVTGCFVIGTMEEDLLREMMEHLPGKDILIFHIQEDEETVYWADEKQYQHMKGYFIFYERNPQMQRYMAQHCEPRKVEEEGVSDRAIVSFREKVKEKTRNRAGGMRYLAGSFLVLTILMLGVTIINSYDKMKRIEETIAELSGRQEAVLTDASALAETEQESESGDPAEPASAGTETPSADSAAAVSSSGVAASSSLETEMATEMLAEVSSQGAAETEEFSASGTEALTSLASETEEPGDDVVSVSGNAVQYLAERNYSAEDASLADQISPGSTVAAERQSQSSYTVKYGDTLADICEKYYGTLDMVEEICRLNQIDDANKIVPGQKIVLP